MLKFSAAQQTEKMKCMEVKRASLEVEKENLSREVEAWKNRVHNLVFNINQIDPRTMPKHLQALISWRVNAHHLKSIMSYQMPTWPRQRDLLLVSIKRLNLKRHRLKQYEDCSARSEPNNLCCSIFWRANNWILSVSGSGDTKSSFSEKKYWFKIWIKARIQ